VQSVVAGGTLLDADLNEEEDDDGTTACKSLPGMLSHIHKATQELEQAKIL